MRPEQVEDKLDDSWFQPDQRVARLRALRERLRSEPPPPSEAPDGEVDGEELFDNSWFH